MLSCLYEIAAALIIGKMKFLITKGIRKMFLKLLVKKLNMCDIFLSKHCLFYGYVCSDWFTYNAVAARVFQDFLTQLSRVLSGEGSL